MKRDIHAASILMSFLLGALPGFAQDHVSTPRQDDVARKGAEVMPFDLTLTTHYFDDTATGGVERVTANDLRDQRQVELIRLHLAHEATQFGRADFSDPAKIHGKDMPGLQTLAAAGDKLHVSYRELPGGGSLTYSSRDPAVIAAIHAWFAAQRSDHAAHAHHHSP
jgi:hypothetical protein